MPPGLFLLLCLIGHVLSKKSPDVDCWVIHLKHINCSWNKQGTPDVNYTFSSGFSRNRLDHCTTYVTENGMNTGCIHPYIELINKRFNTFYTEIADGNQTVQKEHQLKEKVLLYPPVNVTVKNDSDSNLWFYWNQTAETRPPCVENEVRFRINNMKWETSLSNHGTQSYCINLPSSSSRYELQVRSRIGHSCGQSLKWSNWSQPAFWGSNNSTDTNQMNGSVPVWAHLLYAIAAVVLILLVMMFLPGDRLRIIPIPVVPKPLLVLDIEDWPRFSKGLSGNMNYNEYACPVREYCHVSESNSDTSDDSSCSFNTDQTDCSVSNPANNADELSTSCSSSTSAGLLSSQEEDEQVSV